MTKQQINIYIKKCAKKTFNKSLTEIKKDLKENCIKNGFGCSDYLKDNKNGFLLFYTENENFCNGIKNGFGAGFYARLKFCGFVKDIKL